MGFVGGVTFFGLDVANFPLAGGEACEQYDRI